MDNQVTFNLISLIAIIILLTIYFLQVKNNKITSRIFRFMLYSCCYTIITDYIIYYTIPYLLDYNWLCNVVVKLHWIIGYIELILVYLYVISFDVDDKNISIKELIKRKFNKWLIPINIISLITFIIIPAKYISEDGYITFFPGLSVVPIFVTGIIIISNCYITVYKSVTKSKKEIIAVASSAAFILILFFIIQWLLPNIACMAFGITLVIYTIYMLHENPDLYIVGDLEALNNNVNKSKNDKTEMLSSMSNEISFPINNMNTLTNDLNTKYLTVNESKKVSKEILNNGNILLETIDHILDLSKIQAGKDTLLEGEYSLANIVREINENLEYTINKKKLEFKIDIAPNTPNKLFGDSVKIKQIISNILSNSVKYTDYGKILLELKCDSAGTITNLHFRILDTGNGIKEEDFNKVFNTDTDENSAGLGLAITKKYVEQLNGNIKFESTYLAGTIFYIDIPQDIVDPSPINLESTKISNEIVYKNYNRQRIAIVDEDRLNRKVLIELLKDYNFDITECELGIDVLNNIKKGNKYDLILIDHQMAGLDGIDVLNALNVLKKYYEIPPVIMTTANAQTGKREYYLSAGFDDYLSKPISANALNDVILRYVKVKDERGYEVNEMKFISEDEKASAVSTESFSSIIDDKLRNNKEEFKSTMEEFIPEQVTFSDISNNVNIVDLTENKNK